MTDRTALLALAGRVERLTGPDREVDAEIWLAVTPGATRRKTSYVHAATQRTCELDETRVLQPDGRRELVIVPNYTASLDAALTLVLEDAWVSLTMQRQMNRADIRWSDDSSVVRSGATPALAMVAAALRARAGDAP